MPPPGEVTTTDGDDDVGEPIDVDEDDDGDNDDGEDNDDGNEDDDESTDKNLSMADEGEVFLRSLSISHISQNVFLCIRNSTVS